MIGANLGGKQSNYGGSILSTGMITIPSAEILDLFTTPKTMIAAPGGGKFILVHRYIVLYIFNGVAYATNTDLHLKQGIDSYFLVGFLTHVTDYTRAAAHQNSALGIEDVPFQISVNNGNPTLGDGILKVKLYYSIEDI